MSRPIPTHDYVAHFDPALERHRAWLQAALERLVDHEPEALVEGGPLWRLWSTAPADAAGAEAEAPTAASDRPYPNPLVGVPYFQQRDSAQLSQRDRTCFSSSCAMLLEALKPGTLQGANGDDQYLAVHRLGPLADRRRSHAHPPGGERPLGGAGSAQRRHPERQWHGAPFLAAELPLRGPTATAGAGWWSPSGVVEVGASDYFHSCNDLCDIVSAPYGIDL